MTDATRTLEATVDRIEADVVVLDADGRELRVPRELLPGEIREGAGYRVTLAAAPDVEAGMKARIEARLRALTKGGA